MHRLIRLVMLSGAIIVFVPVGVLADPPDGFKYGDWTVEEGQIYLTDECPPEAMVCAKPKITGEGILQRQVRDSDGEYYWHTIVTDDTAGDPNGGSDPNDLEFWQESFVKLSYYYNKDTKSTIAVKQSINASQTMMKDPRLNPQEKIRDATIVPKEVFINTFELTTGDLYDAQFDPNGTAIQLGRELEIRQEIKEYDSLTQMEETCCRGELIFNNTFEFDADKGHEREALAVKQDVYIGPIGGGSLDQVNDPNTIWSTDRERFRFYEIEGAVGSGTMELDTDFDGTVDAELAWSDGDTVSILWFGFEGSDPNTDPNGFLGLPSGGGTYGYMEFTNDTRTTYQYPNDPNYPDPNIGLNNIVAQSYLETGPWYYPPDLAEDPNDPNGPWISVEDNPFADNIGSYDIDFTIVSF